VLRGKPFLGAHEVTDGDAIAGGIKKQILASPSSLQIGAQCQKIVARIISDSKRSSCDHQEVLNIAASMSSAWKLPGALQP